MSYKDYKNNATKTDDLKKALADTQNAAGGFVKDPDEWYPQGDKSDSGYAIIRFLPGPEVEEKDFIHYWTHEFKNKKNGEWYFENCLSTLGNPDPVGKFNAKLWNMSDDDKSPERTQAREQKRKLYYRANVFVIADPQNPENNGKIKKFKFGAALFDFIKNAMNPKVLPGLTPPTPFNPFNLITGANFRIVFYKEDGYRKYGKSQFDPNGPLFDNEDRIETVYNAINEDKKWSLKQYIDPSKFKTYEALNKRLIRSE